MKMIPGKWYFVDDNSHENALRTRNNRKFVRHENGKMLFENPMDSSLLVPWRYAVPVEQEEETMQEGDEVFVSDYSVEDALEKKKVKRIYLMTTKSGIQLCVNHHNNKLYREGQGFLTTNWGYCVLVPKQTELTMAQIAEKFGVPVEQLRIKE
jgi:hypothetical protein